MQPQVHIRRERPDVAAFMFDPRTDRIWTRNVKESRLATTTPFGRGSEVDRKVSFLGRTFWYRYKVIDFEADRLLELTVDRPFPMHVRYELEDAAGGTLARIRAWGPAPGGFFGVAAPLMQRMVERSITADLAALKRHLEGEIDRGAVL